MRRREFITLLSGTAAWPLSALAQELGRKYRIAFLSPNPRNVPSSVALFDELQQFGFVEGQNLKIDHRAYGQHIELLSKYAAELFGTPADVAVWPHWLIPTQLRCHGSRRCRMRHALAV
jgi:putative tryptophan/tyrosine transport system substrate-binding protein